MNLKAYLELGEDERMAARINALAQVAMLPTVKPVVRPGVDGSQGFGVNALIERMTGAERYVDEDEAVSGNPSLEGSIFRAQDEDSAILTVTDILQRHKTLSHLVEVLGFDELSETDQDIWCRGEAILEIVHGGRTGGGSMSGPMAGFA